MAAEKIPLNLAERGKEPQAAEPAAAPMPVQANRRRASRSVGAAGWRLRTWNFAYRE